jgi:hypothetical protein
MTFYTHRAQTVYPPPFMLFFYFVSLTTNTFNIVNMAVINEISAQAAPVGKAVSTKPIPSYMRPTKTSSQRQEAVVPKSKPLKPRDLNSVRTISNGSSALESGTKEPATKQNKPAKLKALAVIKVCSSRSKRYDTDNSVRSQSSIQD